MASVHSGAEIGRTLIWVAGIVAFVIVALTWVPDWISPEGTNAPATARAWKAPASARPLA